MIARRRDESVGSLENEECAKRELIVEMRRPDAVRTLPIVCDIMGGVRGQWPG
jgi:hypothetical protein